MTPPAPPATARAWLDRALLSVCVLGTCWLFAQILMFGYGRDQGIYAVVADTVLRGGMPYRDAWDFKPPGIFVVYALSRALFGAPEWGIRALEVAGLASMVGAFVVLARRFFGDARIGLVGGALAVLVHAQLEFWHTAQPESFGAIATAWAIVLATWEPAADDPRARRKQLAALAAAGALYGFVALLKPPLGGGAVVSAGFAAWNAARRGGGLIERALPVLVMGAASLGVVLLAAAWFAARGALGDLAEALFVFTPHYTKLSWEGATVPGAVYYAFEEFATFWSSASFVGMLLALGLSADAPREREGLLHVFGIVSVQLVGVAMQGKYFPYHFGGALPLGGLVAGLGAWKAWKRMTSSLGAPGAALFAAGAVLALEGRTATRDTQTEFLDRCLVRQRWALTPPARRDRAVLDALYGVADVSLASNRRVAAWLRAHTRPDDRVFIWGFEPVIYDLADRRPATRFVYNVPQRVAWFQEGSRRTLLADLDRTPPEAIVVEHRDVFPVVTGNSIDSADTLAEFDALGARLADGYRLAATIEDFDLYLRRR